MKNTNYSTEITENEPLGTVLFGSFLTNEPNGTVPNGSQYTFIQKI